MKKVALALIISTFCWSSTVVFAEEETAAAGGASSADPEMVIAQAGTGVAVVGDTATTGAVVGVAGGYGPSILGFVLLGAIVGGVAAAGGGGGGGGTITTTTHH